VDTAGFTASSLRMTDADALAARMRFGDGTASSAGVSVNGSVLARSGDVVLLGGSVTTGADTLIQSPNGSTILAAGQQIELTGRGLEGIRLQVQAPADSVVNLGTLKGDAVGIFAGTLKHSGVIQASSAALQGGKVVLKAVGDVYVQGSGKILATGGTDQTGGTVDVLGQRVAVLDQAVIDVSGGQGGGTVRIGGDYQGKNADVPNAQISYFGPQATIKAGATGQGDGGRVIVWADDTTRAYGSISATGGEQGGNGGFVETSGKRALDVAGIRVSTAAPKGSSGNWLLDPGQVDIVASGSPVNIGAGPIFAPLSAAVSTLVVSDLNTALASNDVTIATAGGSGGTGNITLETGVSINFAAGGARSLTLMAENNIVLKGSIENASTGFGQLLVKLDAGNQVQTPVGGTFTLQAASPASARIVIEGGKTWENVGLLNLTGSVDVRLLATNGTDGATFHNTGTVNATGATSNFVFQGSSTLASISNDGAFSVSGNRTFEAKYKQGSGGQLTITDGTLSMQNLDQVKGTVTLNSTNAAATLWVSEIHNGSNEFVGTTFNVGGSNAKTIEVSSPGSYSPKASFKGVSASNVDLLVGNKGSIAIESDVGCSEPTLCVSAFKTATFSGGTVGKLDAISNGAFTVAAGNITVPSSGVTYTGNAAYVASGLVTVSDVNTNGANLTFESTAGDVALDGNITHSASASKDLKVKAAGSITLAAGKSIDATSGTGALNVTLNADTDATPGGAIVLNSGSSIKSKGGGITLGGGAAPATTPAIGVVANQDGVYLNTAMLESGAGNISIRGTAASGTVTGKAGVSIVDSTVKATSGSITLVGGGGGSSGYSDKYGVYLAMGTLESDTGNITLTGTGGTGGNSNNFGVYLDGGIVRTNISGAISITGDNSGIAATGDTNIGVKLKGGSSGSGLTVSAVAGSISLLGKGVGSGTSSYGVYAAGEASNPVTIGSTGAASISITGTSVGTTSNGIQLDAGLAPITVGGATASGNITFSVDGAAITSRDIAFGPNILVQSSGTLTIKPGTDSTSIGVGTVAGVDRLYLSSTDIASFHDGFSEIIIGSGTQSGALNVEGATFTDNLTLKTGAGAITIGSTSVGTNALKLDAGAGGISGNGVTAASMTANTLGGGLALTGNNVLGGVTLNAANGINFNNLAPFTLNATAGGVMSITASGNVLIGGGGVTGAGVSITSSGAITHDANSGIIDTSASNGPIYLKGTSIGATGSNLNIGVNPGSGSVELIATSGGIHAQQTDGVLTLSNYFVSAVGSSQDISLASASGKVAGGIVGNFGGFLTGTLVSTGPNVYGDNTTDDNISLYAPALSGGSGTINLTGGANKTARSFNFVAEGTAGSVTVSGGALTTAANHGVSATTVGGNINITAAGDLAIDLLNAGTGTVSVTAGQSITDANSTANNVIGTYANLVAGSSGGLLRSIDLDTQTANFVACNCNAVSGDITVRNTGSALNVTASTSKGSITLTNDNAVTLSSGEGANIQAAGAITLSATGSITGDGYIFTPGLLSTTSGTGTVLNSASNTAGAFSAQNAAGNIEFTRYGELPLNVQGIRITGAGDIKLDSTGGIDSTDAPNAISTVSGNVDLIARSPLTIGVAGVTATGNIALSAATGGVTLDGPITSSSGAVNLTAATLVQNSSITANSFNSTVGGVLGVGTFTANAPAQAPPPAPAPAPVPVPVPVVPVPTPTPVVDPSPVVVPDPAPTPTPVVDPFPVVVPEGPKTVVEAQFILVTQSRVTVDLVETFSARFEQAVAAQEESKAPPGSPLRKKKEEENTVVAEAPICPR
jgi:hypothetical protein